MNRVLPYNAKQWEIPAILDGRKTVTRRCVKFKYSNTEMKMHTDKYGTRIIEIQKDVEGETFGRNPDRSTWHKLRGYVEPKPPYRPGDILYVRETWSPVFVRPKRYLYKVCCDEAVNLPIKWHPSVHMPKEAARIWLKVLSVRVERLQDMGIEDCEKEGVYSGNNGDIFAFMELWNSAIKESDIDRYGWDANPWVWVIEFERCEKPK